LNPFLKAYWIAKGVGWDNVPRRLYQTYSVRSGKLRRTQNPDRFKPERCQLFTIGSSERLQQWSKRSNRFFPIPSNEDLARIVPQYVWNEQVVAPIRSALDGNYPMFNRWTMPLGWPPNFNRDAKNDIDWPIGPCWPLTTKSGGERDDLKLVWEASRLPILYLLGRAYRYDKNDEYAEAIWQCIESWVEQNPVNQTVAWGCGQEVAFRLMAILFGVFCVLESRATTAERLRLVDVLVWQSASRIETNINYAISQENNHALSEALGLWTVGLLYPELPCATRWVKMGKQVIETEICRQIYADGAYVQHSMSYHRVMLDDMLWVVQLGRINDHCLPDSTLSVIRKSISWLDQFVDGKTGRVPNLGSNDGANVLPLSCSDYLDYRPCLLAASVVFDVPIRDRDYNLAREKAVWLTGSSEIKTIRKPSESTKAWDSIDGGYAILRHQDGYLLLKGGRYRDRPGQCDSQHVDLWHQHENVLRDAGSYHYYHRDPKWKRLFYSAESHNTVQVNDQEQMEKGPNFLWFRWPKVIERRISDGELKLEIRYDTKVPYTHRRTVTRQSSGYSILDSVEIDSKSSNPVESVIRWRLSPNIKWVQNNRTIVGEMQTGECCCLTIMGSGKIELSLVEGWESLYYGEKSRIPVLEVRSRLGQIKTTIEFLNECPSACPP
jgi:hypothetical protein